METLDLLKQLEINYKLMSNDLEFSSHALDSLLKAAARANSSFPDLHALPCRIGALRASIDALATDAAEIIREGKEAAPGLKDAMLKNYTVMVGLYSRLGVAPDPDWVAVADELKHITPASGSRLESECETGEKGLEKEASRAEAPKRTSWRCLQLLAVVQGFKTFARPGCKPRTISKKELGAAGFKVFGLTGDCTLNTLRAMGLVKVTRTGITLVSATS